MSSVSSDDNEKVKSSSGFETFGERDPKKKNAFSYVRVSTLMQVEKGHSLEAQRNLIFKYCSDRNLNLVREYYDKGISGASLSKRKGLLTALQELRYGDTFIVCNLSRLARNLRDAINIFEDLKAKKVSFVILDQNIDTSTGDGEMIFGILCSISQRERTLIGERVKIVMNKLKDEGKLKSRPRFGLVNPGKKEENIENEEEQEVINYIRQLKVENPQITLNLICNELSGKFPPPRNCSRWWPMSVRNILMQNGIIERVEKVKKDPQAEAYVVDDLKRWFAEDPNITIAELTKRLHESREPLNRATKWHSTTVKKLVEKYKLRPETHLDKVKSLIF